MKFQHYQQIPSLKEYVLVVQDEPLVQRFVRLPDETWALKSFVGLESFMELATVPVRIPLADLYAGVEFDSPNY